MYANIVRHSPRKGFLDRNPVWRRVPCLNGFWARNEIVIDHFRPHFSVSGTSKEEFDVIWFSFVNH